MLALTPFSRSKKLSYMLAVVLALVLASQLKTRLKGLNLSLRGVRKPTKMNFQFVSKMIHTIHTNFTSGKLEYTFMLNDTEQLPNYDNNM